MKTFQYDLTFFILPRWFPVVVPRSIVASPGDAPPPKDWWHPCYLFYLFFLAFFIIFHVGPWVVVQFWLGSLKANPLFHC